MHAFESIRAPKDTDAFYARDCSHVPCLCRDRQMPVDMSRIQPTIDGVGAQMSRLRINRRRQVGDGESPTCFESGRRILRPVFAQIGDKLVVSDVLRPILAHVRSKYSNTQHPDPQLRTTSRQTQAKGSAPLTTTNLETPQNHVSCSMWSTCSPQTRFFGPGILIIQTKKGKFAKNTTNSGIKKLAHSRGQFCFKMFPSSQRAVAGPQIWRLPA